MAKHKKMICMPKEDSNQCRHLLSLVSLPRPSEEGLESSATQKVQSKD